MISTYCLGFNTYLSKLRRLIWCGINKSSGSGLLANTFLWRWNLKYSSSCFLNCSWAKFLSWFFIWLYLLGIFSQSDVNLHLINEYIFLALKVKLLIKLTKCCSPSFFKKEYFGLQTLDRLNLYKNSEFTNRQNLFWILEKGYFSTCLLLENKVFGYEIDSKNSESRAKIITNFSYFYWEFGDFRVKSQAFLAKSLIGLVCLTL